MHCVLLTLGEYRESPCASFCFVLCDFYLPLVKPTIDLPTNILKYSINSHLSLNMLHAFYRLIKVPIFVFNIINL